MFSNFNIRKLVIWLLAIMACSFIIAMSIFVTKDIGGTLFSNAGDLTSQAVNTEKVFAVDGKTDISINTVSTDVSIIPVDTDSIKVHFHGDVSYNGKNPIPELVTNDSSNRLSIEIKHKIQITFGIHINRNELKLDVYVPKSYTNNIKVGTVSGKLDIDNITLNSFKFNSVSGSLEASNLGTKDTSVGTTSGEARIDGFTGNLNFNSVSGGLEAEYTAFDNDIDVDTISGSSRITLPEDSQFNVDFNTVSGEFNSDFQTTVNGSNSRHDFKGSVGSSTNDIHAKTVSGGLKILR